MLFVFWKTTVYGGLMEKDNIVYTGGLDTPIQYTFKGHDQWWDKSKETTGNVLSYVKSTKL